MHTHKIAVVVPGPDMIPLVESVIEQDTAISSNIQNAPDYAFSIYVAKNIWDMPREVVDADTIIARGHISMEFRRTYPMIPLVELPIGNEMTAAILSATNKHGKLPVAVLGSFDMCYAAESTKELFGIDIRAFFVENRDGAEIERCFEQAVKENRRIIVCGIGLEKFIDKKNLPNLFVYNMGLSKESVFAAISRAKGELASRKHARERAAQFQLLMNIAHEGIIVADGDEIINAINHEATKLLGVAAPTAMGASLWSILPKGVFSEAVIKSYTARAEIQCQGETLSIHSGRLVIAGELAGFIITLQRIL